MSTVTITGTFKDSNNDNVVLEVYTTDPNGYDFRKSYPRSFSEALNDLVAGESYYVNITGHTTGSFDFSIDGDTDDTVSKTYTNFFMDGFNFTAK